MDSSPLIGVAHLPPDADPRVHHGFLLRVRPYVPGEHSVTVPALLGLKGRLCDLLLVRTPLDTTITTVDAAEERVIELFMDHSPRLVCAAPIDLAGCLLEACQMVRERCLRGGANSILIHPDDVPYIRAAFPPPVGQDGGYRNGRWRTFGSVLGMTAFVCDAAPPGAIVAYYRGQGAVDAAALLHPGRGTSFAEPEPGYTDYSHYAAIIDIGDVP